MIVEAERDDGALLITDGEAAAIVLDGQTWLTTRGAALARGAWKPSDEELPDDAPADLEQRLTALAAELADEEPPEVAASWPNLRPEHCISLAAARSDDNLRDYWLHGDGAAEIRWNTPGDFTRCVKHLKKHVADPKGLCAEYHHEATGMWPGDKRNAAGPPDSTGGDMPNPAPQEVAAGVSVEDIRDAWYRTGPQDTWISEIHLDPLQLIVTSDRDRSLSRVPVMVADGQVTFGAATTVRVEYVDEPADPPVAASRLVYASREESHPHPEPPQSNEDQTPPHSGGVPVIPAAEPEPTRSEEDSMSLSEIRSRLGLSEDATEDAVYAALDDVLDKATAPTPEPVAAAAALPSGVVTIEASVLDELRQGAAAGREAVQRQRTEDRDRFIAAAVSAGKFAPARVEHWTKAYDADPEGTRTTIDGLADGLIPVEASGYTGTPEPTKNDIDDAEAAAWGAAFGLPKEALRG